MHTVQKMSEPRKNTNEDIVTQIFCKQVASQPSQCHCRMRTLQDVTL